MIEDGPKTFMGPVRFLDGGVLQRLRLVPVEAVVVSGAVSFSSSYMRVQCEGLVADNLDTINGGVDGDILLIRKIGAGILTVRDAQDNINIAGDFAMNSVSDVLVLLRGTASWIEVSRANNA